MRQEKLPTAGPPADTTDKSISSHLQSAPLFVGARGRAAI